MSNDFANLEAPSVQARVDHSTATLGDLITLTIQVKHPQALQIENPALAKSLGTFEVYASTRLPTEVAGDSAVEHLQAVLQNFTTGEQVLPGFDVPYRDPLGKEHAVKTPELTVLIQVVPSGPKDKGDIRGIKGVVGPTAWSPWWWLVAVFLVSAFCFLAWRKRQLALAGPPPPPPIPADIVALDKLEALAKTDWLSTGKIKEYYSAISDILRAYVEAVFHTPALERTTSELARDLRRKSEVPIDYQTELHDLLESCDLVKFAKYRPEANEGLSAQQVAVKFVEGTRPKKEDDELR